MAQKPCGVFLLAVVLLLPAAPAVAAPYPLPDDAVIEVREFTFPETPGIAPERNLPAAFHAQLVFALERAGLTVFHARNDTAAPLEPGASSLESIPIQEPDENAAESDAGNDAAPDDTARDDAGRTENPPESDPGDSPPILSPPGTPAAPAAASPAPGATPTHILSGNVTLLRETVGNPTRIAGSIRIRSEASLHCIYRLKDAATGKVLISDVASGSAARVSGYTQDLDGGLESLTEKAMVMTATRIAEQLSGADIDGDDIFGRSYYQDSPGKILRPKK